MSEIIGPNLNTPAELIRLASAVHRFRCPELGARRLSFEQAFKTSSAAHPETISLMRKADAARARLIESLSKSTITYEVTAASAKEYVPLVNQVLWICKLQPDAARLDERLQFEWKSGVESPKTSVSFPSEALMYELVMSVTCQALATGGAGCDDSVAGDFASAGKQFKMAAGIWQHLGQDMLPKWIARGSDALQKGLPIEATTGVADAMTALNLAYAQQMVVSAALAKPNSKPSYSLIAKLTLGISEQIDEAVKLFNKKATDQMKRMDPTCFSLMQFQVDYQRVLSKYYSARATWDDNKEYGMAVAMMQEAAMVLRNSFPEVDNPKSFLRILAKDLAVVRTHIATVLQSWEKDNNTVYFETVPQQIPISKRLRAGMKMVKEPLPYVIEDPNLLPLSIPPERPPATAPTATLQRSDSDLARELQARYNSGLRD